MNTRCQRVRRNCGGLRCLASCRGTPVLHTSARATWHATLPFPRRRSTSGQRLPHPDEGLGNCVAGVSPREPERRRACACRRHACFAELFLAPVSSFLLGLPASSETDVWLVAETRQEATRKSSVGCLVDCILVGDRNICKLGTVEVWQWARPDVIRRPKKGLRDMVTALNDKLAVVSGPNPLDVRTLLVHHDSKGERCEGFAVAVGELTQSVLPDWPARDPGTARWLVRAMARPTPLTGV